MTLNVKEVTDFLHFERR